MNKAIYFLLVIFICSCNNNTKSHLKENSPKKYLHLSHTRTNTNPKMDSVIETIDYSKYDMLWLGGDLAKSTSISKKAISHVDSIFNLGSTNTLWSLGNHDYKKLNLVKKHTKRLPYYSYHKNGITFLILDTQDSLSNIVGKQMKLVKKVLDTIDQSSHLVILHHKLIWMSGNQELETRIKKTSNGKLGDCFHCINPNNFYTDIYPLLLKAKQKGIGVICIGGDIGFKSKEFEYKTPEGIYFLASGIEFNHNSENKGLVFEHDILSKKLKWDFVILPKL